MIILEWSTKICFKWSILNICVLSARNKLSKLDILSIFNICLGVENWKCYLRWHVQRSWQNGFLKKRNTSSPTWSRLEICQKKLRQKVRWVFHTLLFIWTFLRITLSWKWKNYVTRKKFPRPPVVKVAINSMSGQSATLYFLSPPVFNTVDKFVADLWLIGCQFIFINRSLGISSIWLVMAFSFFIFQIQGAWAVPQELGTLGDQLGRPWQIINRPVFRVFVIFFFIFL